MFPPLIFLVRRIDMIETEIVQTVRVACDRCGYGASGWHEGVEPARVEALYIGFHLSQWMQDGHARELWLCYGCYQRRRREEDKGDCEEKNKTIAKEMLHRVESNKVLPSGSINQESDSEYRPPKESYDEKCDCDTCKIIRKHLPVKELSWREKPSML